MKKLHLKVAEQEVEVLAQKVAGAVWFHYEGESYEYRPAALQTQAGGSGGAQDPNKIQAPMPGKVIKVMAQPGKTVAEGDTLVVMEAMKMEYNLKAIEPRVVEEVKCQEGQQVTLGQVLVQLGEIDG
jgi:acetyl/propionyl-CoA carboxylase alpha subunit